MPRWSNTHIGSEPAVLLSRWRIIETDDGLKRLVGFDNLDQGCVSSALVKFDQDAMQAQTSDGSTYRLLGAPGFFWTVVEVRDTCFRREGGATKDVTGQLCGTL
ncbi:hypothetical protein [Burkholderia sp. Ac-20365]|uniref:hypothetical protein n=1 Tax=Burkholderia sp. Ac-20365 TaxID=2703897 RepID=UPI00197C7448|nr:hypothetical protein [Burkholderia sp. Ac-20365]MBN3761968.1 hypothetical protein [Burkholderia sp. Ac-20365]